MQKIYVDYTHQGFKQFLMLIQRSFSTTPSAQIDKK